MTFRLARQLTTTVKGGLPRGDAPCAPHMVWRPSDECAVVRVTPMHRGAMGGPIRHRKHGYILMRGQSDTRCTVGHVRRQVGFAPKVRYIQGPGVRCEHRRDGVVGF
eukprot:9143854-Pyramimonas_sp.AAC.1